MYAEDSTLANGAGDHFFAGQTKDGVGFDRRGLIAFDIISNVPPGAIINSASLTLYRSRGKSGTFDVSLHRVIADWGEAGSHASGEEGQGDAAQSGDATWENTFYPGSSWTNSGGDYMATASATTGVGNNGFYAWSSALMATDVQFWLDTGMNYGWIVIGDESAPETARRFDSRTNPTVGNRPALSIDYTSTDSTGACCLPSDSCAVLTATECANQGGVYQGDSTPCSPDPCNVAVGACCFDDGTCQELTQAQCQSQSGTYQGDLTICTTDLCPLVLTPYLDALPIPPLAVPTSGTQGGTATYDIEMQQVQQQLHAELPSTTVWGYDGIYPGPTILASTGQPVTVNWINDLRDSLGTLRTDHYLDVDLCPHGAVDDPKTVVHLHGGHVPANVDGYPEHTFLPGEQETYTFLPGEQETYVYPNNQQAATIWYHDHALGITRLNVMMGLAGGYVVQDSASSALNLPAGEYDVPLIIQDRKFSSDGSLEYPSSLQDTFFGDKVLVNGKVWPFLNVRRGKYRFRALGGSNSRVYTLSLSTGDSFQVIGNDGGLLPAPVSVDSLTVTPGERYEIVIDFDLYSPGTEIILQNSAPAPFPGTPGEGVIPNVMKFIVQGGAHGFTDPLPATLRPVPEIPESTAVMTRDFVLDKRSDPCAGSEWLINGLHWDDITEYPVRGTAEIWRFINDSGITHPMHMHLVFFQILDRTPIEVSGDSVIVTGPAAEPGPEESGWKDTARVGPNEMLRVITTFEDYLGKYAYHCHILEHEDHEMMRQFEVVDPAVGAPEVPQVIAFSLSQNRPNPFGPVTKVNFQLPRKDHVSIRVYDVRGGLVDELVDGERPAGRHEVIWEGRTALGSRVSAGIYFIELKSGDFRAVRKATVLR
jgi:spore coat protein A